MKYFSTLDAASGFHQLPLHVDSRPKTAFSTRSGLYQWRRLPFGWINAPAVFQQTMDFILRGLSYRCALIYLDDIIVFSSSFSNHLRDLAVIFNRLRYFNCQLNLRKCKFGSEQIEYLGHVISSRGILPKPVLVDAIRNFPSPRNAKSPTAGKKAVKSFVALANFYRRFIAGFARIATPLVSLSKKKAEFVWTPEREAAFAELQNKISTSPVLSFPQWNKPFILSTDACDIGIGAVLQQEDSSGHLKPVQFLSHAFNDRESKWSTPEKELFSFVYALKKFRVYLYGRAFIWRTDASSLQWLSTAKTLAPKLLRWSLLVSHYRFTIEPVSGAKNHVADALSRNPVTLKSASSVLKCPNSNAPLHLETHTVSNILAEARLPVHPF